MRVPILALFLCLFGVGATSAQVNSHPEGVYLVQHFDTTAIPAGWSMHRIMGTMAAWSITGTGINPPIPPYSGSGQAKFNAFDAPAGEQARLTSPALDLGSAIDPFVSFFMYHDDELPGSPDSVYVEVSTADSINGPWITLSGIRRPNASRLWTQESLSLFAFVGSQRLFISLRGVSHYGNNMFLDEFVVADSQYHDIGPIAIEQVETLSSSTSWTSPHNTDSRFGRGPGTSGQSADGAAFVHSTSSSLRIAVQNFGSFVEPSYQVNWKIDSDLQQPVNNSSPLARDGRDTLFLPVANLTSGIHSILAWSGLTADSNRTNDTVRTQIYALDSTIVFFEGFNGGAFPPSGWSVINRDGGALPPWFRGADTTALVPFEGSGFAADNFQRANNTYLDDYLITPAIPGMGFPSYADSIIFWTRSVYNQPPLVNYPDSLMLLISSTGNDTSNFNTILDYINVPKSGWTRYAYGITSLIPQNSTINIAFRYLHYNGGFSGTSSDFVGVDAVQVSHILITGVKSYENPAKFALNQNYPNPFNPTTRIQFQIPTDLEHRGEPIVVSLRVFDIVGREITTLVSQPLAPGIHVVEFDGSNLATGVYFYRLQVFSDGRKTFHALQKMLLIR